MFIKCLDPKRKRCNKISRFLSNCEKNYSILELIINWALFLLTIALIIALLVYAYLTGINPSVDMRTPTKRVPLSLVYATLVLSGIVILLFSFSFMKIIFKFKRNRKGRKNEEQ